MWLLFEPLINHFPMPGTAVRSSSASLEGPLRSAPPGERPTSLSAHANISGTKAIQLWHAAGKVGRRGPHLTLIRIACRHARRVAELVPLRWDPVGQGARDFTMRAPRMAAFQQSSRRRQPGQENSDRRLRLTRVANGARLV